MRERKERIVVVVGLTGVISVVWTEVEYAGKLILIEEGITAVHAGFVGELIIHARNGAVLILWITSACISGHKIVNYIPQRAISPICRKEWCSGRWSNASLRSGQSLLNAESTATLAKSGEELSSCRS